jgi:hypothetical protein
MNKPIRSNVINGDESARVDTSASSSASTSTAVQTPSPAAAGLAAAVEKATAEHRAAKAIADAPKKPTTTPVQPAFNDPVTGPATPRDDNHGKGGQYHVVDGKRVRVEPNL